jgi:hypothetical protein
MKNITLAMIAALAAVTMLSAVLSVAPMQQASAGSDGDSRDGDGGDGGNSIRIDQENECEDTMPGSCTNFAEVPETTQEIFED